MIYKKLLASILVIFFAANLVGQAVGGRNIRLVIENQPEGLLLKNAGLQSGPPPIYIDGGNFQGTLKSVEGKTLFEFEFFSSNLVIAEDLEPFPSTTIKILVLPYYKNVGWLEIKEKKGTKELRINLGFLAELCGNGVCESGENTGSCPIDCKSGQKDSYCDKKNDNHCDPDCSSHLLDQDCESAATIQSFFLVGKKFPLVTPELLNQKPGGVFSLLQLIGFVAIAAIIVGLILFGRRIQKKRAPPNNLQQR